MDGQVEVKDYVNIDPNEAFADNDSKWADVLQQHRDAGYTDSQIVNKFDNSNWVNGAAYNKWRSQIDANHANFIAGLNTDQANQAFNPKPDNIGDFSNNMAMNNDMFKPGNNAGGEGYDVNSNYDENGRIKELREQFSNNDEFRKAAKDEGIELAAKGSMMNIQEAYLNGHINKGERNYLILDAIQTAMSNAGNTLMNIAAAYTGGSGNNPTNQKAMWQDRMRGVNEAQTTAMQRGVEGSTQEMERKLSEQDLRAKRNENTKVEYQLLPAEAMARVAQDKNNPGWLRGIAMSMTADFAGNDQDLKDTIVTALAQSKNEISEAAAKEGISEIEYLTRELGKIGAGFTSDVVNGLAASVSELSAVPLGAAQDKANELVYGEKKEANVDFVTPEQAQRVSNALSNANLGIVDDDTINAVIQEYKKSHPGRGVNLNEIAVNVALYKARKMGAKIDDDAATDWLIKARGAKDADLDKIIAKIGKKVPKVKY